MKFLLVFRMPVVMSLCFMAFSLSSTGVQGAPAPSVLHRLRSGDARTTAAISLSLVRSTAPGRSCSQRGEGDNCRQEGGWNPVNLDSGRFGSSRIATNSVHLQE